MPSFRQGVLFFSAMMITGIIATGCTDQSEPVAYVNGTSISQDDYLTLLEMQKSPYDGSPAGKTTLKNMIEQQLMLDEAKKEGLAPTQEELNAALQQLRQDPSFQDELKNNGLTEEKVLQLFIAPQLATTRVMAKLAGITNKDVQDYFAMHHLDLNAPPQVRVRVLQFTDRKRAEDAEKIVGTTSFETIAQTFGGPSAGRVETLDRRSQSPYPKEVIDAAFKTAKGQTTPIIEAKPSPSPAQAKNAPKTPSFYIIYVEDQLPARLADMNNPVTHDQILRILIQQRGQQKLSPTALQDFVEQLKKKSTIEVVRPSVKSVEETAVATPAAPNAIKP